VFCERYTSRREVGGSYPCSCMAFFDVNDLNISQGEMGEFSMFESPKPYSLTENNFYPDLLVVDAFARNFLQLPLQLDFEL